jgi:hypothetical protein
VTAWWRLRNELRLVNEGGKWSIQGNGREDARIAYATLVDEKLTYVLDPVA